MVHLDSTNLRLLELLQKDARTSIIDLARAVDRAESTVRERVAALERDGVLRGYRALVDAERLGYGVRAVVRADCDRRRVPDLAKRLAAIAHVLEVRLTTGPRPLVIEVAAESMPRLEHLIEERIAPLELQNLEVSVAVRTLVEARPLPLHAGAPAAVPAAGERSLLPLPAAGPRAEPRLGRPVPLPSGAAAAP